MVITVISADTMKYLMERNIPKIFPAKLFPELIITVNWLVNSIEIFFVIRWIHAELINNSDRNVLNLI